MKLNRKSFLAALSLLMVLSSGVAEARRKDSGRDGNRPPVEETAPPSSSNDITEKSSDADLLRAVSDRRRVNFVEGGSLTVTQVLSDDNKGAKHQKWIVKLTNGSKMQAVYNSDMCPEVPIKVGDVIAMGGQFLIAGNMPMLHWLHGDPEKRRPAGYVYLNGKFYCKDDFVSNR